MMLGGTLQPVVGAPLYRGELEHLEPVVHESFVKGILTKAEYLEMQEDYSQKISGAVERVQQLQSRQSELERQMERYTSMADKLAAVDKDTALSSLLVNQLIERVTVNGPDDVSISFAFESGFERVMEVLGNDE